MLHVIDVPVCTSPSSDVVNDGVRTVVGIRNVVSVLTVVVDVGFKTQTIREVVTDVGVEVGDVDAKGVGALQQLAKALKDQKDIQVMIEGHTDNVPISKKSTYMNDNWDLSVKRATAVVRALQKNHNVDPNRLIAAGRGEFNALVKNDTEEGRSTNRRTRIIILPKLDQFYDLLNPTKVPN